MGAPPNFLGARDNPFLALLTFGEGYHNFHHTLQVDYRNGVAWYDWAPSKWLIRALAALGLADNLKRTPDHTLLHARFEQRRAELQARLRSAQSEAGARVEALRCDFARARLEAEKRLEDALLEFRSPARRPGSRRAGKRPRPPRRSARPSSRSWSSTFGRPFGRPAAT